ncbi:MAG: abortive infection family protein, partial [Anaerolineae bacterium]|nr:abortive infection family protein [Anaerolineae bacterium]
RVNNYDWDDDWILTDPRFNLIKSSDEVFLRFICETVHPAVRINDDEVHMLVKHYIDCLRYDGWELFEEQIVSGQPIYSFRQLLPAGEQAINSAKQVTQVINTSYIHTQIKRLENSIEEDPELAIGTAKEFIETICKTILLDLTGQLPPKDNLPKLVRSTLREIKLTPEDISNEAIAADTIRQMLMNLASISNNLAQLRNSYGVGHGKEAKTKSLEPRHAKLAVGAATTLAVFLFETHQKRKK